MFYCEDCRKKEDWPTSFVKSHGPCEICKLVGECHARPSSTLPYPKSKSDATSSKEGSTTDTDQPERTS